MRHLALAACVVLTGSSAEASRHHAKSHHHKAKHARHVAVATDDTVDEKIDADVRVQPAPGLRDWHVAVGPNVWASSVDAKVSLGSSSVSTGVDFIQTAEHARYGIPLIAEARYGRFSFVGDFMYGVIDIDGARTVGPVMVTLNGTASSLMFDGFAGYRLTGDDHSLVSVDARAGVRYQRTAIAGSVDVDGSTLASEATADAGADGLAGMRVTVRPTSRVYVSGNADFGFIGSSTLTWSAAADANVRVSSRVLVSLGWRTMTMDRGYLSIVMHGPRAALQLLF